MITGDGIAIVSVLLIAVVIAGYVHYSMKQVRELLPREILEQQRGISAITHSLGKLVHVLDRARLGLSPAAPAGELRELHVVLTLLRSVRRDYTFDSLTGASAVHALVNPAAQDIERWLLEGVPGYARDSTVVLNLAHQRAGEVHGEARELEAHTNSLASSLLAAEAERLNQVRNSLVALILAFAVLAAGVAVLYMRQRNAQARFAVAQGRLTDSIESIGQAVALFDRDQCLVMCNQRFRELYDLTQKRQEQSETLLGVVTAALQSSRIISVGECSEDLSAEYRMRRQHPGEAFEMQWNDGRHFQVCEHTTHEEGIICFLTDITDLKHAQRKLEHLATHDALTGLPSRRRFERGLGHALERARRNDQQVAVIFMDIDRLKWVNDTHGHVAGDGFLRELGLRLRASLRDQDLVARLGGDEFAVILEDIDDWQQAAASAERALEALSRPVHLDSTRIQTTASMGIALFPADAEDAATLTKRADDACYHAKSIGRANVQFYTERINVQSARRGAIEHHLRIALQNKQLNVFYQPQMSLQEQHVTGLEALLRWEDPALGRVEPSEFVPIAEDSGLGRQLLRYTSSEVCRQLREWLDEGLTPCRVWINVSPRQLMDVVSTLSDVAERHGVRLDMLGVEITERTLVEDPKRTGRVLAEIKRSGISLAIDDFGVGYSSLSALKEYPVDELKIDASFVRNLSRSGHDVEIVRAIVALAGSLDLRVVAEGVETVEQLSVLQGEQVSTVQGNIISDAVRASRVRPFLSNEIPALPHVIG